MMARLISIFILVSVSVSAYGDESFDDFGLADAENVGETHWGGVTSYNGSSGSGTIEPLEGGPDIFFSDDGLTYREKTELTKHRRCVSFVIVNVVTAEGHRVPQGQNIILHDQEFCARKN